MEATAAAPILPHDQTFRAPRAEYLQRADGAREQGAVQNSVPAGRGRRLGPPRVENERRVRFPEDDRDRRFGVIREAAKNAAARVAERPQSRAQVVEYTHHLDLLVASGAVQGTGETNTFLITCIEELKAIAKHKRALRNAAYGQASGLALVSILPFGYAAANLAAHREVLGLGLLGRDPEYLSGSGKKLVEGVYIANEAGFGLIGLGTLGSALALLSAGWRAGTVSRSLKSTVTSIEAEPAESV